MLGRAWLRGLGDLAAGPPAPSMLAVPFQPYLMFGAQYGWFDQVEHEAMLAREGPKRSVTALAEGPTSTTSPTRSMPSPTAVHSSSRSSPWPTTLRPTRCASS